MFNILKSINHILNGTNQLSPIFTEALLLLVILVNINASIYGSGGQCNGCLQCIQKCSTFSLNFFNLHVNTEMIQVLVRLNLAFRPMTDKLSSEGSRGGEGRRAGRRGGEGRRAGRRGGQGGGEGKRAGRREGEGRQAGRRGGKGRGGKAGREEGRYVYEDTD